MVALESVQVAHEIEKAFVASLEAVAVEHEGGFGDGALESALLKARGYGFLNACGRFSPRDDDFAWESAGQSEDDEVVEDRTDLKGHACGPSFFEMCLGDAACDREVACDGLEDKFVVACEQNFVGKNAALQEEVAWHEESKVGVGNGVSEPLSSYRLQGFVGAEPGSAQGQSEALET